MAFLGIDLGTTAVKAVLTRHVHPTLSIRETYPVYKSGELPVASALSAMARCLAALPADARAQVEAVQVTGQMHGVALWGKQLQDREDSKGYEGREAGDEKRGEDEPHANTICYTWEHRRLDSEPELLAALQRTSPSPLYAGYGCGTLLLLLRDALSGQPDETDCPAQLFPPHAAGLPELAVCLLTGAAAPCTSPSLAAAWGFYDAGAVQWDLAAVSALAPTVCSKAVAAAVATHLPTLLPAGAEAGRVTATAAERYGLPIGARVFVALGDNQCQVAAQAAAALGDSDSRDSCGNAGVETETEGSAQHANRDLFVPALRRLVEAPQRVAFLNVGTSAQLTLLEPEERSDQACAEGMLELRPLLPGLRMLTVSSLNGGNVLAAVMHAANSTLGSASDTLEPLARLPYVPTTRLPQLCCVPRLYGERKAEAARMSWEGIDAEALEIPGALASALCRGLVANLYDALPAAVRSSVAAVYCGGRAAELPCMWGAIEEVMRVPAYFAGASAAEGAAALCAAFASRL